MGKHRDTAPLTVKLVPEHFRAASSNSASVMESGKLPKMSTIKADLGYKNLPQLTSILQRCENVTHVSATKNKKTNTCPIEYLQCVESCSSLEPLSGTPVVKEDILTQAMGDIASSDLKRMVPNSTVCINEQLELTSQVTNGSRVFDYINYFIPKKNILLNDSSTFEKRYVSMSSSDISQDGNDSLSISHPDELVTYTVVVTDGGALSQRQRGGAADVQCVSATPHLIISSHPVSSSAPLLSDGGSEVVSVNAYGGPGISTPGRALSGSTMVLDNAENALVHYSYITDFIP